MNGCFKSRAIRRRENPYGAFESPYVAHRPVSIWDQIGNPHVPVWLSTSLLWSQHRRKPVSESCTSSTFSYGLYGAHTGLKFSKIQLAHMACCGITHRCYPYGARKLLGKIGKIHYDFIYINWTGGCRQKISDISASVLWSIYQWSKFTQSVVKRKLINRFKANLTKL